MDRIDITYTVRLGGDLPEIESLLVTRQDVPCPPAVLDVLYHKIIADLSLNSDLREFTFTPFRFCPIQVTIREFPNK